MKIKLAAGSLLIATSILAQVPAPKPATEKAKPTLSPRGLGNEGFKNQGKG